MSYTARFLLFGLRVYQAFFSALMPSACKFYPSCSHYAVDAVRLHGARRGSWLALRRISRCHPFTKGGVDLVPDPAEHSRDGEVTIPGAPAVRGERAPVDTWHVATSHINTPPHSEKEVRN